jgi:ATP-dependent DNA helicase RecG
MTLLRELPGDLAVRIGELGNRKNPTEIRCVVLAMCRLREWRAEELATVLKRNIEYVRNNYIRPMVRDGSLSMTNPDEPNDPKQAYRTQ